MLNRKSSNNKKSSPRRNSKSNQKKRFVKKEKDKFSYQKKEDSAADEYFESLNIKTQTFHPHDWYSETRKMKREFYFHMGPTNSGKTYAAINSLKNAGKGIYWAPLRLLAWEVAEKLNNEGVRWSLRTGQEKSISEFDTHTSWTIEMANPREEYDVAIIDEVQMISDQQRGWAWTNAILGIRAKEIHLWGDQRSLKLISELLKITNETIKRKEYKRMSKLRADSQPIRSLKDLKPGDCIVGFSRKTLFQMKSTINEKLDDQFSK